MNEQFGHWCNDVIADVDDDNADHDDYHNDADDDHHDTHHHYHDTHDHYHDADNSKPFVYFSHQPHNRSSSLSRRPASNLIQKSYPMIISDDDDDYANNYDNYSNNHDHNAHHCENL